MRYPREGELYEAIEDVRLVYLTYYFDLPYTGGGDATLPEGERVRVRHSRGDKPVGAYCDPLRYEELHDKIVAPDERANEMYRGYYFAIDTNTLNRSFKFIVSGPATGEHSSR